MTGTLTRYGRLSVAYLTITAFTLQQLLMCSTERDQLRIYVPFSVSRVQVNAREVKVAIDD